jgi:ABC-type lipoprotein export system ATPase subunit/bifunctional DNA-binding transcriptional regulator/antitoxin component of YhaV-PrlF toxin-antitoxin module
MSTQPLILCENLVKIYRLNEELGTETSVEVQALQGLDLTVESGELIGVVGASGSGKSTLLNILGGLDTPTGGRAVVDGRDLGRMNQFDLDEYRRRTVGFVWQQGSRNLLPYLTARENIQLPMTMLGQSSRISQARSMELLEVVGLADRGGHRLYELSGGEQQRVAVAIALANQPRLLLTDEPTGELDSETARMVYDLLRDLNRRLGVTIIVVSHDPGISHYVDRVVAVRDGKLASETYRVKAIDGGEQDVHHFEELVILDSAGRVQIPRDFLEKFHIHRRARLEVTDNGILIRSPEKKGDGNVLASSSQVEEIGISGQDDLKTQSSKQSWLSRFLVDLTHRVFKRSRTHPHSDGDSGEELP